MARRSRAVITAPDSHQGIEFGKGTEWLGGRRKASKTSSSQDDFEGPGGRQAAGRALSTK